MAAKPLSPKRLAFVLAFVKNGGNATSAYLEVYGGKRESAANNASRLIGNDGVRAEIERHRQNVAQHVEIETGLTKTKIVEALWGDYQEYRGLKGNPAAANRALELLGKELGMFQDRKHVTLQRISDLTPEAIDALLADLGTIEGEATKVPDSGGDGTPEEADGASGGERYSLVVATPEAAE